MALNKSVSDLSQHQPNVTAQSTATFLLLPGLDGSAELFAPLLQQIPPGYPHLALRYPAELNWQLSDYADYVCQQVQGIHKLVIIAESFSGPVAVLVAQRLQQRCQALILAASFVTCPHPMLKLAQHLLTSLPFKRCPLALTSWLLFGKANAELKQRFQKVWHELDQSLIQQRLSLLAQLDLRQELATLKVPLLYLRASHDWLLSSGACAQISIANNKLTVQQISAPHGILQTQARACWQQIARWLASQA